MKIAIFDIEANGLELNEVTKVHCICVMGRESGEMQSFYGPTTADGLDYLDTFDYIVAHNQIWYDLQVLKSIYGWVPKAKIIDTIILSRLLQPDRPRPIGMVGAVGPHSIEAWAYRLGGEKKVQHTDWQNFSNNMLLRCESDVRLNAEVYNELLREAGATKPFDNTTWKESFELEQQVAISIRQQEINGWKFDLPKAKQYLADLDNKISEVDAALRKELPYRKIIPDNCEITKPFVATGGLSQRVKSWLGEGCNCRGPFSKIYWEPINLNSDSQLKEYFFSIGWVPDEWNIDKKTKQRTSPKLTETSLDKLSDGLGKMVAKRLVMTHRRSQLAGLIENVRCDNRIEARANTIGTPTGRFTHKIVVNIPKATPNVFYGTELRSLFTVDDGNKLIGCDAKGLENRMLAHYLNDERMTFILTQGDFHTVVWKTIETYCHTRSNAKNIEYALIRRI